jgi:hypothetical protein
MKKQVQDYISSIGGTSCYSGNTKTLYITDLKLPMFSNVTQSIEECVFIKFGFWLPFKITTNY